MKSAAVQVNHEEMNDEELSGHHVGGHLDQTVNAVLRLLRGESTCKLAEELEVQEDNLVTWRDEILSAAAQRAGQRSIHRLSLLALVIIIVIIVLSFTLWLGPALLTGYPLTPLPASDTPVDRLKSLNDARTPIVATLAGLAALVGLYFTARTVQINQRSQIATQKSLIDTSLYQAKSLAKTSRYQTQSLVVERYGKAVEQLTSERLEQRVGAMFSLERVGVLSKEDLESVVQVLCAFVTDRTRNLPKLPDGQPVIQPSRDVILAMEIISRLPHQQLPNPLVLNGARLSGVILKHRAKLDRAELAGVDLAVAQMPGIDLTRAILEYSTLRQADLTDAVARGANFRNAILNGAKLNHAKLTCGVFSEACMRGIQLQCATLIRASLNNVDLSGANCTGANLRYADLRFSNLKGVVLTGADLRSAVFEKTTVDEYTWWEGAQIPLDAHLIGHLNESWNRRRSD